MIYSQQDFLLLERMEDEEIVDQLEKARQAYDDVQAYFTQLEGEASEICSFDTCKPDLSILFSQLKNIEAYIRKAENLMNGFDDNRYICKAIKNRKNRLDKFKTNTTKKKKTKLMAL